MVKLNNATAKNESTLSTWDLYYLSRPTVKLPEEGPGVFSFIIQTSLACCLGLLQSNTSMTNLSNPERLQLVQQLEDLSYSRFDMIRCLKMAFSDAEQRSS